MNAKRFVLSAAMLFALLASACGAAATEAPSQPPQQDYYPGAPAAEPPYAAPMPTYSSGNEASAPGQPNAAAPNQQPGDEP